MKKYIIGIMIGLIIAFSISASAIYLYKAKDISFTPNDINWDVDNLQDALNDIKNNYVSKSLLIGKTWTFEYTGGSQKFEPNIEGTYKIELWGASGGQGILGFTHSLYSIPSRGAYVEGEIVLSSSDTLYVYVGGAGSDAPKVATVTAGGYNGGGIGGNGGSDDSAGSGGGATDIRVINGNWNDITSLRSRIMVASGAGGTAMQPTSNAYGDFKFVSGGGLTIDSQISSAWIYNCSIPAVTQTSGFNFGGTAGLTVSSETSHGHGGGGGGWYTGSSCFGSNHGAPGSGGTSYISGHDGCRGVNSDGTIKSDSVSYTNYSFTNTKMIDGNGYNWTTSKGEKTGMPTYDGTSTMTGNIGNGYAKITLISID